jgi:cytochrome c biogenesis protein CcdA
MMQIPPSSPSPSRQTARTLRLLATPLEVAPGFYFNLAALWAGMSWLMGVKHPSWSWLKRIFSGALTGFALIFADVGHAFAHTFSARAAGAPMDQIRLTSSMPRTVYFDESVPPRAHILRALGGPIFSALGFMISRAVHRLVPCNSVVREVASWSSVGHGLIFVGSLAPLPIVDGGSILKWSLVESGQTPAQADQIVQQAGIATALAATTAGAAFAARRKWLPAAGLLAAGLVAIAAAKGKVR